MTGGYPKQRGGNAESVSMSWRYHGTTSIIVHGTGLIGHHMFAHIVRIACWWGLWIWFTLSAITKANSRFAPSQWETALLCNDVSHWLGASLQSALYNTTNILSNVPANEDIMNLHEKNSKPSRAHSFRRNICISYLNNFPTKNV